MKTNINKLQIKVASILVSLLVSWAIYMFIFNLPAVQDFVARLELTTLFLFVIGFPVILSAFLYLVGCKILMKENLADNLAGAVIVGILMIVILCVFVLLSAIGGLSRMGGGI